MYELESMIEGLVLAIQGSMVFMIILGGMFCLMLYFVHGYAIMCTGHKAKVDGDFMPFVPVARQLYQMKIANCPWWYIFFFEMDTLVVNCTVGLILALIGMLTKMPVILFVLFVIYFIANRIFTFLYYQNYYRVFGFNPNTAWLNIIPTLGIIATVFEYLIAFSNAILHKDYVNPIDVPTPPNKNGRSAASSNSGVIAGVSGKYLGANFDMLDGAELVFGRDPLSANIVFDQTATDISRKHCSVRFDGKANQYIVTDFSSTGTYLENGVQLEKGQPKTLAKGTVIYLGGSKQNGFRLN